METDKQVLLFTDNQYDIFTDLDTNGFEHAKNFLEIAVGSLNDFITQGGLSKEEGLQRLEATKMKFDQLYNETKEQLK